MSDDYQSSLDYLYGRLNYERSGMPRLPGELRLGRMRRLLRRLGDPQDGLKIVHVAGTKGKGSTSVMLASALAAADHRLGLYCSPHLNRLEERFQVNGVEASRDELVGLVETLKPVVADLDANDPHLRHRGATFFEITTAMGLLHFARKGAKVVVLEVGMGGRLDSTNVVRPLLSVITSISLDHTRQLGNTLGQIAREKAGIIKHRGEVVSGVRDEEARASIHKVVRQRRARVREIGSAFDFAYDPPSPSPPTRPTAGTVRVRTWRRDWPSLTLPLLGAHQAQNAALALATLDALAEQGIGVEADDVRRGFATLRFPARVEILGESPWLVVDGAHNVASAEALARTLETCFPPVPRTLVFGTTREKDLRGQLQAFAPLFDRFVATQYVENPRAVPAHEVAAAIFEISGQSPTIEAGPAEALATARSLTSPDGLLCVTGSLFLAAEVRAILLGLEPRPLAAMLTP